MTALPQLAGRVLIVEDNPTNQRVIDMLLKRIGITPFTVENGQAALESLIDRGEAFDILLMDLQMPVMDGYEATRRLRAWEAETGREPVPIVALTADAFAEDRERCLQTGMDDFLTKPIVVDDLVGVLGRWLTPVAGSETDVALRAKGPRDLDVKRFESLVDTLLPMLERGRFDAIETFCELEKLAQGTPTAPLLVNVRLALDAFSFDKAQAALTALRQQRALQETRP
jgi:CheY-like chemotaxis protein